MAGFLLLFLAPGEATVSLATTSTAQQAIAELRDSSEVQLPELAADPLAVVIERSPSAAEAEEAARL